MVIHVHGDYYKSSKVQRMTYHVVNVLYYTLLRPMITIFLKNCYFFSIRNPPAVCIEDNAKVIKIWPGLCFSSALRL